MKPAKDKSQFARIVVDVSNGEDTRNIGLIIKGVNLNGFFVDVGAHNGITINNTLYFEKYNG